MSTLYYENYSNSYVVSHYTNNERHKISYSINKYGKYAKSLAEKTYYMLEQTNQLVRYNNWYEEENAIIKIIIYEKDREKYHEVLIDKSDFDIIKEYYWAVVEDGNTYYAVTPSKNKNGVYYQQRMHRLLLGLTPEDKEIVDHDNGNGIDNRRSNIKISNHSANNKNRVNSKHIKDTSLPNGVHFDTKTSSYCASCNDENGKRYRKTFSINKYGEDDAKRLAIEWRFEKEEEFNYKK